MEEGERDSAVELVCPICAGTRASSLAGYLKHIRLIHSDRPNLRIKCNLQNCQNKAFSNFKYFRNHVYDYHDNICIKIPLTDLDPPQENQTMVLSSTGSNLNEDDLFHNVSNDNSSKQMQDIQQAAAVWILKTRECNKLTQTATKNIIQGVDSLYQVSLHNIQCAVERTLASAGIQSHQVPGLEALFSHNSPHSTLFAGLDTEHNLLQYIKNNFKFVEPVAVTLGKVYRMSGSGHRRQLKTKKHTMMYVPILKTLEVLLQNRAVYQEVVCGHKSTNGFMRDYCDGTEFSTHPLFTSENNSLQLLIYYDNVEICNPLGSKRTKHKHGFFYFILANVSPQYRSQMRWINLVAIVKQKWIKKYSMNAILTPIVEDFRKLESGHMFEINGVLEKFHGTIAVISADNLGSCALAGFKEGSTAYRGCRHCMALVSDIKTKFIESELQLRTLESHSEHCAQLEDGEDCSVLYGVNYRMAQTAKRSPPILDYMKNVKLSISTMVLASKF